MGGKLGGKEERNRKGKGKRKGKGEGGVNRGKRIEGGREGIEHGNARGEEGREKK